MSDQKVLLSMFAGEWDVEKLINKTRKQTEGSFYLCNMSDIIRKYDDWILKIPRVSPFYAMSSDLLAF